MSIEAMKNALDVLVHVTTLSSKKARDSHAKAVSGLREAIAAAEKAKAFRFYVLGFGTYEVKEIAEQWAAEAGTEAIPLYTTPPDTAAMLAEKDALLRQALEVLEAYSKSGYVRHEHPKKYAAGDAVAEAIRNHLGVET